MDRRLKAALKAAYSGPPPERKRAFLKTHRRRELSSLELLVEQLGYIRWWTWVGSAALFALIVCLAAVMEADAVWTACALTPMLALLALAECGRSRRCGMEELELVCRVSLRTILLVRMTAIGLLHLFLLGVAAPVLAAGGSVGILRTGVYLLTPYLLTSGVGMELSRRIRGQEGLLACAAGTVLMCALGTQLNYADLYGEVALPLWRAVLVLTLGVSVFEWTRAVKETEELQWS